MTDPIASTLGISAPETLSVITSDRDCTAGELARENAAGAVVYVEVERQRPA